MIARVKGLQRENLQIHLNIDLRGAEGITETLMQLLTRATLPAQGAGVETTQPSLFPEAETQEPIRESFVCSDDAKPVLDESNAAIADADVDSGESMTHLLNNASVAFRRKRLKATKDQRKKYETSAKRFDEWWHTLHRSTEPVQGPLDSLREDSSLLEPLIRQQFSEWCLQQEKKGGGCLSPQTVKTYWQNIVSVCSDYGLKLDPWSLPALKDLHSKLFADGSGLNPTVAPKRDVPFAEELDAIALHATAATSPYGEHSPYFYRGLTRFFTCFGIRTQDVIGLCGEKKGIRKQDLSWDPVCPAPNVNAALGRELINPSGWVWINIWKARHSDEKVLLLPIPSFSVGWFKFFNEFSSHAERVFPSTFDGREALSQTAFSTGWKAIREAAKVPRIQISEGGTIKLRNYSANWWELNVAKETRDTQLAKNVSDYILHHKSVTKTVGDRHYRDVRAQCLPIIVDLLPTFPVPAADASPVSMLPE